MLEIDGSQKSGSGTIVRYSTSLASLLGQSLLLINIREKRAKKGLRKQHLKAIEACCELTKGKVTGLEVGSQSITYFPGETIQGGKHLWDIGTAGSTTMLAQTVMPLGCFANSSSFYEIQGGLFQDFAPAAHHLQRVVIPLLKRMNLNLKFKIKRPGYVPTGGGIIEIQIKPTTGFIKPLTLEKQGKIAKIEGIALSSHLEEQKVSDRMKESCNDILKKSGYHADIQCLYDTTALQRGASLTLFARTSMGSIIGVDMAGKIGRTSETIGKKVAKMLLEDLETEATVDRFTADQLILYAALAQGTTTCKVPRITEHIETNLWLIEKILGAKVKVDKTSLTITGIGFQKT